MGIALEIGFDDSDAAQALDRLSRGGLKQLTTKALDVLGKAVAANAASEQIIRGGRGKGKYAAPPNPLKLTSRSGDLRRSIISELEPSVLSVRIGSDLDYSRIHELGDPSRNMPKRAYLAPALKAEEKKWSDIFSRIWARSQL